MNEFDWEQNHAARQAAEEETNKKAGDVDLGRGLVRENENQDELLKTAEDLLHMSEKEYEAARAKLDAIIASGKKAVAENPAVVTEAYGEYLLYLDEKIKELYEERARVQNRLDQDNRVPATEAALSSELVYEIRQLGGTSDDQRHFENRAKKLKWVYISREKMEPREAEDQILDVLQTEILNFERAKKRKKIKPEWTDNRKGTS